MLQTIQMNLVLLWVWEDRAVLGSTKTQKLKYATFEDDFLRFHGLFSFKYPSVRTKNLDRII